MEFKSWGIVMWCGIDQNLAANYNSFRLLNWSELIHGRFV